MRSRDSRSWTRRHLLCSAPAAALAIAGTLRGGQAFGNALHVGAAAPPASLVSLDGSRHDTQDLLDRVVILTFWATWCVPCRQELPLLSAYAAAHAAQGLTVLGFCLDGPDKLAEVARIAQTLSFPVGLLSYSSAFGYGRIWRLPVNFTIDSQGRLVDDGWRDVPATWTTERLERVVTPLLGSGI